MRAHERLYAQHIQAAHKRWHDAVRGVKALLHYKNQHMDDAAIRKLTARLLTIDSGSLWGVLGSDTPALRGYAPPYSVVDRLEFIGFFVGHEILDDGEPGVGYYRFDRHKGHVTCAEGDKGAMPYFHSNVDVLRGTYPHAKCLDAHYALDALEQHAEAYAKYKATAERLHPDDTSLETGDDAVCDRLVAQLAAELLEEPNE